MTNRVFDMIRFLDKGLKDKSTYDTNYKEYTEQKTVSIVSLIFAFDIDNNVTFKMISNKIRRAVDECYRVHEDDNDDHKLRI